MIQEDPVGIVLTIHDQMEPALVEAQLLELGATNINIQEPLNTITCSIPSMELLEQVRKIEGVTFARTQVPVQIPPIPPPYPESL